MLVQDSVAHSESELGGKQDRGRGTGLNSFAGEGRRSRESANLNALPQCEFY